MSKEEIAAYTKFFGKKVATESINIDGYDNPIPFDIYDGFAVCENSNGHFMVLQYPKLDAIKNCEELAKGIIDYLKNGEVTNVSQINVIDVLVSYSTLYEDGVEVLAE